MKATNSLPSMSNKRPLTAEEKAMAARMKAIIASSREITEESVADAVGVTQGQVSHWTGGRLPVPAKRAQALAAALGIADPGEISLAYRDIAKTSGPEADWADIIGVRQAAALGDGAIPDEYSETHKLKFRTESLRRKRLRPDRLAVVYGRGDSMHPTIKNGDAILFDTSDNAPRDGGLFVITYDGELFAKRLMELDGTWYAKSDNDSDPKWRKPRKLDPSRGIEIAGRIRWVAGWVD